MREKFKGKYIFKKSVADPSVFLCLIVAIIGLIVLLTGKQPYLLLVGIIIVAISVFGLVVQVSLLSVYKIEVNEKFLTITNGVLSKREEQIQVSHITSVKTKQDLFGRIFGYGDIIFDIMGKGPTLLPHIKNAEGLKDYLNSLMF